MSRAAQRSADICSKARLRLWLKLLKATGAIETEIRRRLREEFDTTLPRFDVMSALARHPEGLKMSEISGLLRVSNGNVTGIVDRLAEERLVLRVAVPGDKRAHRVHLTQAGTELFARQAAAHELWIDGLLKTLDGTDLDAMSSLLTRLNDMTRGERGTC
ncbi:MAG: MarR family transcriptional regulator [Pseudomonadota bacterium]